MPLRCEALIVAAICVGSYSYEGVRRSSSAKNNLPRVPGCTVREPEDSLGLYVFCNSFHVPYTSLYLPNNTITLQIYRVYDLDVEKPLLKRLFSLRELRLPDNKLNKFSSRILEGLSNLRYLNLRDNYIKSLPKDTFSDNPLLEEIDLTKNRILSVAAVTHSLSDLVHFRRLVLEENLIFSSLTYSDFSPLRNTSFQSLDLVACAITQVDKDAFEPLENLSELDISWTLFDTEVLENVTKSLKFSSLRRLKMNNMRQLAFFPRFFLKALSLSPIEEIDFSFGRLLTTLPKGGFHRLKHLDMTACGIRDDIIGSDFSDYAPNLQTLILRRNLLLTAKKFAHLTKLEYLDLSNPYFVTGVQNFKIEDYDFQNLVNLQYLYLEGNSLQEGVKRYTFHGLRSLKRLSLNRCLINFVEQYAFETLHDLEGLDLSYNNIETLDSYTFYGLKRVKVVNLEDNVVTSLNTSLPFQQMPALESLILSGNKISQLPPRIFSGLFSLGIVKLENNFVVPWHERLFSENVSISFLKINSNMIDYFSAEMLDDVRQIKALDFSYNPLNCSVCGMKALQSWMRNTTVEIQPINQTNTALSPYACMAPLNLQNVSILEAEIPIAHCMPEELDMLLSLSIAIPFLTCFLISIVIWHFLAWHIRYCCFKLKSRVRSYKKVTKSDRYKYDAFVSYSPSDILWVRNHLIPALESDDYGYQLCVPDRNFEASINITENVFDALQNSRSAILVLSNEYLNSEWCKFDMNIAQHKLFEDTRSLILILLENVDNTKMTKNLKYIIKTRTFIPWTNNSVGQKLFWERLRSAVVRPNQKVLAKHIT